MTPFFTIQPVVHIILNVRSIKPDISLWVLFCICKPICKYSILASVVVAWCLRLHCCCERLFLHKCHIHPLCFSRSVPPRAVQGTRPGASVVLTARVTRWTRVCVRGRGDTVDPAVSRGVASHHVHTGRSTSGPRFESVLTTYNRQHVIV